MSRTIICFTLLACLSASGLAVAQQELTTPRPVAQTNSTDIGTLQAQLAQVEAERQRLAEQLARGSNNELLERLQLENRELLGNLAQSDAGASARLEAQRQQWFMIGGGSVLASLFVGFLLASMGRRRKRNEWLN